MTYETTEQVLNGLRHYTVTLGMTPVAAYYLPAGLMAWEAFKHQAARDGHEVYLHRIDAGRQLIVGDIGQIA
jgi:hypothetical protein